MPLNVVLLNSELYSYNYFLQEDICRLCWSQHASNKIMFLRNENPVDSKTTLFDQIKDCLNIDLSTKQCNYYPNKVCNDCCNKIENFHNFKRLCQENERKLHEIFKNHLIDTSLDTNESLLLVKEVYVELDSSKKLKSDNFLESPLYSNSDHTELRDHETVESSSKSDKYKLQNSLQNSNIPPSMKEDNKIFEKKLKKYKNKVENPVINHKSNNNVKKKPKISIQHSDTDHTAQEFDKKEKNKARHKKYKQRSDTYCNICHKDLITVENFTKHSSECHGIESSDNFKCFGCDRRFKIKKRRTCHEKYCKGLKDGYKCNICLNFLPKRSWFEMHMKDHRLNNKIELPDAMFKCSKCLKLFKSKESLKAHMVEHRKKYICETCGRSFLRQDYLLKHRTTHGGTKNHVCPHCPYRTAHRTSIVIHMRKHTGERPYACDLCPQRCVSASNLGAHRRRHLGIKQFECEICSKKFGYKLSLNEHIASCHKQSRTEPCCLCGATYSRRQGLQRHLRVKHGINVVKNAVEQCRASLGQNESSLGHNVQILERNKHLGQNDQSLGQAEQTLGQNEQTLVHSDELLGQNVSVNMQNVEVQNAEISYLKLSDKKRIVFTLKTSELLLNE